MGIDTSQRLSPTGAYRYSVANTSIIQTAHALPAGFLFFANSGTPTVTGVPRDIMIKRIAVQFTVTAATAMPSTPSLAVCRGTFTGVLAHSGGSGYNGWRHRATDLLPQGTLRTAATGLTALAQVATPFGTDEQFIQWYAPNLIQATAVGLIMPTTVIHEWKPEEGAQFIIKPNEALIIYQLGNGEAADTRRFNLGIETMEFRQ